MTTRREFMGAAGALGLWPAVGRAAVAPPVVRIATTAYTAYANGGKQIGGNILSTRIIEEKSLEAALARRGVRLEWVYISGDIGPATNEAFASNRIDFANIGDLPSIILNARGVQTRLVVPNGRGSDLFLVVPPDSRAASLQDLKGKRISVQASRPWDLGFRKLVAEQGLRLNDFRIFNLDPNASQAALANGNIDGFFHITGHLVEERKLGRIIWSSKGSLAHKIRSSELWGTRGFVERYPDITQLVANAYVQAQHWVSQEANRGRAEQEATLNGTPLTVVRRNFADPALSWRDHWTPLYDDYVRGYYRQAAQLAYASRAIGRPLQADDLFAPQFVNTALSQLQLGGFWKPAPSGAARTI